MPTNQQRREAAKRKLQRQLQRREEQDRARRQRLVIVGVVAAVLVISGGVWLFVSGSDEQHRIGCRLVDRSRRHRTDEASEPTTPCSYPAAGTAAKDVTAPTNLEPLNSGTVDSTIVLNGQDVPVSLDRALAPCGVNSFLSLASQGFYDNTSCHRLTVSDQLNILQCGDPSGKGNGGPGLQLRHRGRHRRDLPGRHRRAGQRRARTPTARSSSSSTATPRCRRRTRSWAPSPAKA